MSKDNKESYTDKVVRWRKTDVREYHDKCIRYWRKKKKEYAQGGDTGKRDMCNYYIDAFQSMRVSLFGELLEREVEEEGGNEDI